MNSTVIFFSEAAIESVRQSLFFVKQLLKVFNGHFQLFHKSLLLINCRLVFVECYGVIIPRWPSPDRSGNPCGGGVRPHKIVADSRK